ncbi:MAG: DUF2029 domain-containing protein, partial [Candidatus Kerfeldbacteria bacterium]|nr:DUF2029 domain-containing protein [Candidatus Kerfeldbacteria bacterium]
ILAGVVLATATVIKVFPALCVIHLFMQKQWKALITYFFTLIAWFLLAWPFFHSSGIMYFFTNRIPRFVRGDVGFMKESVSVFGSTRAAILQNDLAVFGQSTQALIEHLHRIAPYLSIVILGVSVFFLWKDRRHTQGNYWLHLYGVYIALLMLLPQATHLAFLLWITPVLLYWIHKVDVHNTRTWWYALLALCVGVVTQFWNIPHVYVAYRTILYMKLATVALVAMLACSLLALRRGHKHVV